MVLLESHKEGMDAMSGCECVDGHHDIPIISSDILFLTASILEATVLKTHYTIHAQSFNKTLHIRVKITKLLIQFNSVICMWWEVEEKER
jgi:hypothetical protein